MKILVTGSNGMLGLDLVPSLQSAGHEVIATSKEELDITDSEAVVNKLRAENPKVVINCAAYTAVDNAEREQTLCHAVNVDGVRNLVDACMLQKIVLMQISTDYVFAGTKESYDEQEPQQPINAYGKSKAEGEKILLNRMDCFYLVRTSWLFGRKGKNFITAIQNICLQKGQATIIDDQFGKPTYTKDLARALLQILEKPYGIYHATNEGTCTWFELAREAQKYFTMPCGLHPCTTADYPLPAKRPKYSVLNNNKIAALPHWKDAVRRYMEETT